METATIKQANQPIKIVVGLLACRVLKVCKLQSFLRITCRSNYLLLLPAVRGWTYAAGNLQPHVKGRSHPYGVCSDRGSLCLWCCISHSTRWHTRASGEKGTAAWEHHSASMLCELHLAPILMHLEVSWPWSGPLWQGPCGALAQRICGETWGGQGLVRGNCINLSNGWFVASSTNHVGKQGQPTPTASL